MQASIKKYGGGYLFKIFKNKRTRFHPSVEIESDKKNWKNLEITDSPTEHGRYIKLDTNPNPKSDKPAYVRKYIRNDPIRTRGELMKKYSLSENDMKKIEEYVYQNFINKSKK